MNTETYLQGYIYKLKTLHSIELMEVGKLMLINYACTYTHTGYPIMVCKCYIPEFLHFDLIIGSVQIKLVKYPKRCYSDTM